MIRNPTMNDVAAEAGVALKTVSRYVNGETNIDPALAARIGDAIRTLGYRRNLAAASIRPGRRSRVLGLIIGDLANPYYSVLARSIETYSRDHGYLLITASSDEDGARHDELVDRMMEQRVDGLLIVPPRSPGRSWTDVSPPIPPIVFLDRPADYAEADTILADNAGGAHRATLHFLKNGLSRVAFIGDSLGIHTMAERYRGYLDAHRESGCNPDQSLVYSNAHTSDDATRIVLELLGGSDASAIFAANNRAAVGALVAFKELGRRIPLIGFDDFEAARLSDPQVSVVSQDIGEMGTLAARVLIDRLGDTSLPVEVRVLPTSLVLRGSELG